MGQIKSVISICNSKYVVAYNLDKGTFDVVYRETGAFVLRKSSSYLEIQEGLFNSYDTDDRVFEAGASLLIINRFEKFELIQEILLPEDDMYILVQVGVRAKENIEIKKIGVIKIAYYSNGQVFSEATPDMCKVFTSPYYKIPALVRNVYDGFNLKSFPGTAVNFEKGFGDHTYFENYKKDYKGVIRYNEDLELRGQGYYEGFIYNTIKKSGLVFGFVTANRFMPEFSLSYDKAKCSDRFDEFEMYNKCESIYLNVDEMIYSETAYLNQSSDVFGAREHYAQTMGTLMESVVLDYPKAGWCSWHKKWYDITELDVLKQLVFVSDHPDLFPNCKGGFEYIQIDYGWQKNCGRPEQDEVKFPHGMKYLADRIHDKGFKAGIWMAPAIIEVTKGEVFPFMEYFIQDENGQPIYVEDWFGRKNHCYFLDVTHPQARAYALEQLHTAINVWGYDMVKLDFLEGAIVPIGKEPDKHCFYNKTKTSIEHLRDFCFEMVAIAEQSERDIFISPCGSPVYHMAGIFKSNYIAEDAGYMRWDEHMGVMSFAETWALRSNLNGRIFTNNLESVLLDEPRPMNEARINISTAALSGGVVFIGDMLSELSNDKLKIYSKMLPLYHKSAKPVDIFDNQIPCIWNLKVEKSFESWNVVGVYNWENESKGFTIDLDLLELDNGKEYELFEFWEQHYLGKISNKIEISDVLPRSDLLLCIRQKKDFPWVLSTDTHFTQGAVEIEDLYWNAKENKLSGVYVGQKYGDAVISIIAPLPFQFKASYCINSFIKVDEQGIIRLSILQHNGGCRKFEVTFDLF